MLLMSWKLLSPLFRDLASFFRRRLRLAKTRKKHVVRIRREVYDTGIDIEKEHMSRLCERFYRVDKSRSKTGLGLAIVNHICALYGAKFKIEREIDVGKTVTVVFKAVKEIQKNYC